MTPAYLPSGQSVSVVLVVFSCHNQRRRARLQPLGGGRETKAKNNTARDVWLKESGSCGA